MLHPHRHLIKREVVILAVDRNRYLSLTTKTICRSVVESLRESHQISRHDQADYLSAASGGCADRARLEQASVMLAAVLHDGGGERHLLVLKAVRRGGADQVRALAKAEPVGVPGGGVRGHVSGPAEDGQVLRAVPGLPLRVR